MSVNKDLWKALSPIFGLEGRPVTRFELVIEAHKPPAVTITEAVHDEAAGRAAEVTKRFRVTEVPSVDESPM